MTRREEDSEPNMGRDLLLGFFYQFKDEIVLLLAGTVAALVRAAGVTIESGQTGLLFSFGRVKKTLDPGFHLLIPFLQSARRLPTRSRTIDLPAQRVVTTTGLVYHVDANLVYRITDVHKALVQIDDVEKGMRQVLGLGVQEVVRASDRQDLMQPEKLERELAEKLSARLAAWGVTVERAGLTSITPSKQTLRITQIGRIVGERETMLAMLAPELGQAHALCLIGTRVLPIRRHLYLRAAERRARRVRRLRTTLMRRGWMAVQIKGAARRLRARSTTGGRLRATGDGKKGNASRTGKTRGRTRARKASQAIHHDARLLREVLR
ncbi:MAG: regulator of protease activity HflC (stomatin/prohibitin superfamily) [Chlamydiales bacterium]